MHHPGPPRFTSIGECVQLAPRNPDPTRTFHWSVLERPSGSTLQLDDDPVVELAPDVPGIYRVQLDAPDGTHELTVRAFPDERRDARFVLEEGDLPVDREEIDQMRLGGSFNNWRYGPAIPEWRDASERDASEGAYVYETQLAPDNYRYLFAFDGKWDDEHLVGGDLSVAGPGQPRLHLDADRTGDTVEIDAHATPPPESESDVEVEFYVDDRDDVADSQFDTDGQHARLPVDVIEPSVRIQAVPVGERHGVADTLQLSVDHGTIQVERPNDPPGWVRDARIYEIFIRAFAGGRLDTTFDDIRRRLPYLEWLGVDAIWFTPILASPTRHGYHITDYFETAADLGTRDDFESLVDACHDHDIRVIFDLVINHTAVEHPYFQMSASGVDQYRDWYLWDSSESGGSRAQHYFNWTDIPNVNYRSLSVRQHMLAVVDEWAAVVDGFRADVAWGVPHSFWKEVRDRVKTDSAEFLLLDETVPREVSYTEGEFDLHHHTDLHDTLVDVGTGDRPATAILDAIERTDWMGYPDTAAHLLYVENHDEDRYLDECGRDALKAAVAAIIALPGVPMVYAGQERGMTEYRDPMEWADGDTELTTYHRALLAAHEEHAVLRCGTLADLNWQSQSDSAVAFALEYGTERIVVALNFGTETAVVDVDETLNAKDLFSRERVEVDETPTGSELLVEDAIAVQVASE